MNTIVPPPAGQGRPGVRASVIIPAFNASAFIDGAIASVQAQTERALEIIVVDDASADDTAARVAARAAADPRITLLRSAANAGPGPARNRGIAAARGDWVALLDADDRYHPRRIETLLAIGHASDADVVSDNLLLCGQDPAHADAPMIPPGLLRDGAMLGAVEFVERNMGGRGQARQSYGFMKPIVRRRFLDRHDLRYDDLKFAEDFVLALRYLIGGARWALCAQPLYLYTVRGGSLTESHSTADLARLVAVERAMLGLPRVMADEPLGAAMRRHVRSVELALSWRLFAEGVKARDMRQAVGSMLRGPDSFGHICREGVRAVPRAARRLGLGR